MMHEKLLNAILASNCPLRNSKDGSISLHVIDLHCNTLWVIVRLLPMRTNEIKYEILSYKFQGIRETEFMDAWVSRQPVEWAL